MRSGEAAPWSEGTTFLLKLGRAPIMAQQNAPPPLFDVSHMAIMADLVGARFYVCARRMGALGRATLQSLARDEDRRRHATPVVKNR